MEPNIQILSESNELEEDKSWWKVILIFAISAAILVWTTSSFKEYLMSMNGFYLLFFSVGLFLLLVLSVLEVFLIKGRWKIFLFTLLETFLPFLLFIDQIKNSEPQLIRILILLFLFAFYFILIGKMKGIKRLANSLNIKFFETSKIALPKISTGFLMIFAILFYFIFFEWHIGAANAGKIFVASLTPEIGSATRLVFPSLVITPNEKMSNILENLVVSELKTNKIPLNTDEKSNNIKVTFNQLPEEMRKQILTLTVSNFEKELKNKFDFFDPNQTGEEFVYSLLNKYFNYLENAFGFLTNIVLVALLFFVVRSVLVLLYWLIKFFAFIVFKLLLAFGFIYVTSETKAREFILLS